MCASCRYEPHGDLLNRRQLFTLGRRDLAVARRRSSPLAAVRTAELIGRYGGEEFALIQPDVGTRAGDLGERIRWTVGDTPIYTPTPVRCR